MSPAAAQSAPRERQSERELPALICAQSPTGGTPPPTTTVGTQGGAQAGSPGESLGQCLLCPQASWSLKDWCSTPPPHAEGRAGRLRLSGGKGLAASGRCHGEGAKVGWCVQGRQKAGQGRQAGSPARWFVRSEGSLRPRWWMAGWGSGM